MRSSETRRAIGLLCSHRSLFGASACAGLSRGLCAVAAWFGWERMILLTWARRPRPVLAADWDDHSPRHRQLLKKRARDLCAAARGSEICFDVCQVPPPAGLQGTPQHRCRQQAVQGRCGVGDIGRQHASPGSCGGRGKRTNRRTLFLARKRGALRALTHCRRIIGCTACFATHSTKARLIVHAGANFRKRHEQLSAPRVLRSLRLACRAGTLIVLCVAYVHLSASVVCTGTQNCRTNILHVGTPTQFRTPQMAST